MDWDEPLVVIGKPEEEIVPDDMADADELISNLPQVIVEKGDGDNYQGRVFGHMFLLMKEQASEPRRFKEKKQKYARNAKKLVIIRVSLSSTDYIDYIQIACNLPRGVGAARAPRTVSPGATA